MMPSDIRKQIGELKYKKSCLTNELDNEKDLKRKKEIISELNDIDDTIYKLFVKLQSMDDLVEAEREAKRWRAWMIKIQTEDKEQESKDRKELLIK